MEDEKEEEEAAQPKHSRIPEMHFLIFFKGKRRVVVVVLQLLDPRGGGERQNARNLEDNTGKEMCAYTR